MSAPAPGQSLDTGARSTLAVPTLELLAALGLALLTALLHGSALQGGWRFDDPAHLQFAASHAPWQYFGVREVMLQQSYAHITPWNAFFYEIGLPWFGLQPRGHYAHLLAVLWATAVASWVLLRRWLHPAVAFIGAALFLAMPPTAAVAQQLMTGHYAYGLLFSVLALHGHVLALSSARRWPAWLAAGCYALACLCKELYVPLVLLAVVCPAPSRARWWRAVVPWLAVAVAYTALRFHVVGGIGGYAQLQAADGPALLGWWDTSKAALAGLFRQGLGPGLPGAAGLACIALIVAAGWAWGRRPRLVLTAVAVLAMLVPIWPLFRFGLFYGHDRLLLLVGWAVAVLCAWQLQGWWLRGWRWPAAALAAVLLGLLVQGQATTAAHLVQGHDIDNAQQRVLVDGQARVLVPHGFAQTSYLSMLADAAQRVQGVPMPEFVDEEDAFLALGPDRGATAWAWQDDCACVRPLGTRYAERALHVRQALAAGAGRVLQVHLNLASQGPYRSFRWRVEGPAGQVLLHVKGFSRQALPASGSMVFGLDNTTRLPDPVRLRVLLRTPDGALVRTPWLSLPLNGDSQLSWPPP